MTEPILDGQILPVVPATAASTLSDNGLGLFQNYPKLVNTSELSLEQCGKEFSWPAWESHVLTRTQPVIQKQCELLWVGDNEEVDTVSAQIENWTNQVSDESFLSEYLSSCAAIQTEFTNFYVSEMEKNFPIAFLMNVHVDPQQIARFLKSIYRSTNVYCLHVDLKSPPTMLRSMQKLADCLPNVILAKKRYNVQYSTIDQVDALRSCYKELLKVDVQWKYAVNLCGRELPLKTNREIVQMLMDMEGVNVANPGVSLKDPRVLYFIRRRVLHQMKRVPIVHMTTAPLGPLPGGITAYKNNTFIAATRDFVKYLFEDDLANDFYLFLRDVQSPDEEYFSTLNHLPEAPGSLHQLEAKGLTNKLPQVSASFWFSGLKNSIARIPIVGKLLLPHPICKQSHQVHGMCVAGIRDLSTIKHVLMDAGNVMFFNKFMQSFDPVVMDCAEQNLIERNRQEFLADCKLLEAS